MDHSPAKEINNLTPERALLLEVDEPLVGAVGKKIRS